MGEVSIAGIERVGAVASRPGRRLVRGDDQRRRLGLGGLRATEAGIMW
jgi:hypothetical protein